MPAVKSPRKTGWKRVLQRIGEAQRADPAVFPVNRLHDFRELFYNTKGDDIRLKEDEFVARFGTALNGTFTIFDLRLLFSSVDVERVGSISWDDFTTYCIHLELKTEADMMKNKEFVYDGASPAPQQHEHKDTLKRIAVNYKHDTIVTAGFDGQLKQWSPNTYEHIRTVNNTKNSLSHDTHTTGVSLTACPITDIVFGSHDNYCFVSALDKSVHMYDAQNMGLVKRYIGRGTVNDLDTTSKHVGGSKNLVESATFIGMYGTPGTIDVSYGIDREMIYMGMQDGSLMCYPVSRHFASAEIKPALHCNAVHAEAITKMRFVNDPSFFGLISCGWDGFLKISHPERGTVITSLDGAGEKADHHSKGCYEFDYNPRVKMIASAGCERDVFLWSPTISSPIAKLQGHGSLMLSLVFNPVDNQLITLSQDNILNIWDLRTQRVIQSITHSDPFNRLDAVTYSSKSHRIIAGCNTLHSWSIRRSLSVFPADHTGHTEVVQGLSYSSTDKRLISCDSETVMAWNPYTGKREMLYEALSENQGIVLAGMDSFDRRWITVHKNGHIRVWNAHNGQSLGEYYHAIPRNEDVIGVFHMVNHESSIRCICVMYSSSIAVFHELGPEDSVALGPKRANSAIRSSGKFGTFNTHVMLPATGTSSFPTLAAGTVKGFVVLYSVLDGGVKGVVSLENAISRMPERRLALDSGDPAPFKLGKREKVSDKLAGAALPNVAQVQRSIESLTFLETKDLLLSASGTSTIMAWDITKFRPIAAFGDFCTSSQAITVLAVNRHETLLYVGDDSGVVSVFDVSQVPKLCYDGCPSLSDEAIVLTTTFRASWTCVVKLIPLRDSHFVAALGSDNYINMFNSIGTYVGSYGQARQWDLGGRDSWALEVPDTRNSEAPRMPPPMSPRSVARYKASIDYEIPVENPNGMSFFLFPFVGDDLDAWVGASKTVGLTKSVRRRVLGDETGLSNQSNGTFLTAVDGSGDTRQQLQLSSRTQKSDQPKAVPDVPVRASQAEEEDGLEDHERLAVERSVNKLEGAFGGRRGKSRGGTLGKKGRTTASSGSTRAHEIPKEAEQRRLKKEAMKLVPTTEQSEINPRLLPPMAEASTGRWATEDYRSTQGHRSPSTSPRDRTGSRSCNSFTTDTQKGLRLNIKACVNRKDTGRIVQNMDDDMGDTLSRSVGFGHSIVQNWTATFGGTLSGDVPLGGTATFNSTFLDRFKEKTRGEFDISDMKSDDGEEEARDGGGAAIVLSGRKRRFQNSTFVLPSGVTGMSMTRELHRVHTLRKEPRKTREQTQLDSEERGLFRARVPSVDGISTPPTVSGSALAIDIGAMNESLAMSINGSMDNPSIAGNSVVVDPRVQAHDKVAQGRNLKDSRVPFRRMSSGLSTVVNKLSTANRGHSETAPKHRLRPMLTKMTREGNRGWTGRAVSLLPLQPLEKVVAPQKK